VVLICGCQTLVGFDPALVVSKIRVLFGHAFFVEVR
jgi:hypothetical protein